jgi:hypothetical protein
MTRQGGWTEAAALRPGDALMPLHRHRERGREVAYQPLTGLHGPTRPLGDDRARRGGIAAGRLQGARPAAGSIGPGRTVGPVFRPLPGPPASVPGGPVYRNHRVAAVRELPGVHDTYCLTVPGAGNFALEAGCFVANCGIIVNVTPLEPEWEGHVTLEFSNTTPLPAKIYAREGCAQMLFFQSDEVCETSYKDRGGKYQGQRGVTLPKT